MRAEHRTPARWQGQARESRRKAVAAPCGTRLLRETCGSRVPRCLNVPGWSRGSRAAGTSCSSPLDRGEPPSPHTWRLYPPAVLSLVSSLPFRPVPCRPPALRLLPSRRPLRLPLPPPLLLPCVLFPSPPLLRAVVPVALACFACLPRPLLRLAVLWVPLRWPFAAASGPGSLRPGPWVPWSSWPRLSVWASPPGMDHTFGR